MEGNPDSQVLDSWENFNTDESKDNIQEDHNSKILPDETEDSNNVSEPLEDDPIEWEMVQYSRKVPSVIRSLGLPQFVDLKLEFGDGEIFLIDGDSALFYIITSGLVQVDPLGCSRC